ncbi:hypothetical protein TWF696_008444 [Orbilia brochopaga]|uniref:Uncharacterized protein n=1 Tax=Orbilia brochopaga TaxID=3140254 RepID=A0AAV9UJT4_9PEZI
MLANIPRWLLFGFILGNIRCRVVTARLITIPLGELYYWVEHDAGRTLRDFANAVAYTERLWHRLLPYSLPKGTNPDAIIDGRRQRDVSLENLLEGLQDRISIAKTHFEFPETPVYGSQWSYNIHGSIIAKPANRKTTVGKAKSQIPVSKEDDTVEFVSRLQNIYEDILDQSYCFRGLHRWINDDILQKKDLKTWWKDEILIAMSVASARVDPNNKTLITYDSFQRELWSRYLADTEAEFEDVHHLLEFFSKLYLRNPLPPSPGGDDTNAPDDFHIDLRVHLSKISEWFVGWEKAAAVLRDAYDDIPPLPTEQYAQGWIDSRDDDSHLSSVWGLRQWTGGTLPVSGRSQGQEENQNARGPLEGGLAEEEYNVDAEDFGISDLLAMIATDMKVRLPD